MMHWQCTRFSGISLLLLWLTAPPVEPAHAAVEPAGEEAKSGAIAQALESKLALIARMIASESGIIERSGHRDAIERLQTARQLRQTALDARTRGEMSSADAMANEALRAIGHALRVARSTQNGAAAWRIRHDEARARIAAFRQAYARINAEKSRTRGGVLDEAAVDGLVARAEKQHQEGSYRESVATLNRAAVMVESALMRIRDKETLIYELKFNSPEEEYGYERSRNQSYEMLVEIAMTEGKFATVSPESGAAALGENRVARELAEASLRSGDPKAGIKTLETATAELMRVLRAGGLPLP